MQGISSRSWGTGSIVWRPGNVHACVHSPRRRTPIRDVTIARQTVSEGGSLMLTNTTITNVDDSTTVYDLLTAYGSQLVPPLAPSRLKLSRDERQLEFSETLGSVGVLPGETLRLRVLRRSIGVAKEQGIEERQLNCVTLRTMTGTELSMPGLEASMDVKTLRALVSKQPVVWDLWKEALATKEAGKGDTKKEKDAPKPSQENEVPLASIVLFGVGDDLDLPDHVAPPDTGATQESLHGRCSTPRGTRR